VWGKSGWDLGLSGQGTRARWDQLGLSRWTPRGRSEACGGFACGFTCINDLALICQINKLSQLTGLLVRCGCCSQACTLEARWESDLFYLAFCLSGGLGTLPNHPRPSWPWEAGLSSPTCHALPLSTLGLLELEIWLFFRWILTGWLLLDPGISLDATSPARPSLDTQARGHPILAPLHPVEEVLGTLLAAA
jgi:hypothetical protein